MHSRWKRILAVGLAVLVVGGITGGALAASGSGSEPAEPPAVLIADGSGPFAAAADYLGLTRQQVLDALANGKSLAQLAADQEKSVDGLKSALIANAKSHLDQAVTDGKLTAAQESELLSDLSSRIGELVDTAGLPAGPHAGLALRLGPPAAIADYLGLSAEELRAQLESGRSLAAVAEAQGKSVEGLESAMLADAKAHLDAAVAAGRISADREQQLLDELKSRIDDIVNRTGPPPDRPVGVQA